MFVFYFCIFRNKLDLFQATCSVLQQTDLLFQVIFSVPSDTFYLIHKQEQRWEDNEDHRDLKNGTES